MIHRSHLWLPPNPSLHLPEEGRQLSCMMDLNSVPAHHHTDSPQKAFRREQEFISLDTMALNSH